MSTDTILRQKIYLEKILMSKWDMFQDKRNNIVFKVETQQIKTRPTCFTSGASGKESACQCRMCGEVGFDLWVWKIPWRRKWQPTPVFLPGKSQGQKSLGGYSPRGHKESEATEQLTHNDFCQDSLTFLSSTIIESQRSRTVQTICRNLIGLWN